MGEQGVVTIMQGGKVMAKVVAGCSGKKAMEVGKSIAKYLHVADPTLLLTIAEAKKFGCERCRAVVARHIVTHSDKLRVSLHTGDGEVIGDLQLDDCTYGMHLRTFDVPAFNPRWRHGTADRCVIVNMDTKKVRYVRYNGPKLEE